MATINTIAVPAKAVRSLDTGMYNVDGKPVLPIVTAAGDSITLFTFPHDGRIVQAHLRQPATVGAGVTLKLQRNRGGTRVDLTGSTTAATAGTINGAGLCPTDFLLGDTVEVLVSGGMNAAVGIEYDLTCQRA